MALLRERVIGRDSPERYPKRFVYTESSGWRGKRLFCFVCFPGRAHHAANLSPEQRGASGARSIGSCTNRAHRDSAARGGLAPRSAAAPRPAAPARFNPPKFTARGKENSRVTRRNDATGDPPPPPPPYRGSAPDDALRLVRARPQLLVAEGGGAGGEGGVVEEPPLLQALLAQRPEVLPQVGHSAVVPPRARRRRPLLRQRRRHPRHRRHRPAPARHRTSRHGTSRPRLSALPSTGCHAAAQPRRAPRLARVALSRQSRMEKLPLPGSPARCPVERHLCLAGRLVGFTPAPSLAPVLPHVRTNSKKVVFPV